METLDTASRAAQRKRLRRLARVALSRYGIEDARVRFVSDTDNAVFCVDAPGGRYALRIDQDSPSSELLAMLEAEMRWLAALRRDTNLSVPEPVAAQDGALVQVIAANGVPEAHPITLLRWLPGQPIKERPTASTMAQLGAFIAELHCHAEGFVLPDGAWRPRTSWDKLRYWMDPKNDTSATLTASQRSLCAAAAEQLLADLEQVGIDRDYGLIHADLHLGNCLLHEGKLGAVDFGDCRFASFFYDLAVPLTYLDGYKTCKELRFALYEGYSRVRPLSDQLEAAVRTFIAARAFDNIEWIHFAWPSLTHHPWGPGLVQSSVGVIEQYLGQQDKEH